MKKIEIIFKTLIVLVLAHTLTQCEKDEQEDINGFINENKQILAIVYENNDDSTAFFYDSDGLLVETIKYEENFSGEYEMSQYHRYFEYDNGKLTIIKRYFEKSLELYRYLDSIFYDSEGKIVKMIEYHYCEGELIGRNDTIIFSYNQDNQIDKFTYGTNYYDEFTYTNDNITTLKEFYNGTVSDETNYIFDNKVNPFIGNPYYFLDERYFNTNNIIEYTSSSGTSYYEYIFNNDGFPLEITYKWGGNKYVRRIYYK